ncbi:MAG: hypothetical protein WC919_00080 [Candidatus Paceibacterota bacterium]
MNNLPLAQRAMKNGKRINRWKIEGHNGLFRFRVTFGRKQRPLEGETLAKYGPAEYNIGCFQPDDDAIPPVLIPVEKIVIAGKPYFRVSWGSGWRCIQGEEWTAEIEQEARKTLADKHITELEFAFKDQQAG